MDVTDLILSNIHKIVSDLSMFISFLRPRVILTPSYNGIWLMRKNCN